MFFKTIKIRYLYSFVVPRSSIIVFCKMYYAINKTYFNSWSTS